MAVKQRPTGDLRQPRRVRREWLDEYVRRTARARGARRAREAQADLSLFIDYFEQTGRDDVSLLPWWEYSLALEWISERTGGFRLTLGRARRLLDTLRDFCVSLVQAGHLPDCWHLERARAVLCGGRTLRLLARPPYSGSETWTTVRSADGRLLRFSMEDCWLSLLWRHCGHSWAALVERVRQAPGSGGKLQAIASLRTRIAAAGCSHPMALFVRAPSFADLEDALRWVSTPSPETVGAEAHTDDGSAMVDTALLVDRLRSGLAAMPRSEMEELLRRGDESVRALTTYLRERAARRTTGDPLWAIVVLGELRRPEGVEAIGHFLGGDEVSIATAASEALGKIGAPALPLLFRAAEHGEESERIHAYGALAAIDVEDSYVFLVHALFRDPELRDVVARALAAHGRRDAIEPLHLSSRRSPAWMRREIESAIVRLVHGTPLADPVERDWRVRYRRLPGLGWGIPPSWVAIAALAHRHREGDDEWPNGESPPRSLSTILGDTRLRHEARSCGRCGGAVWRPAGLPLCRHTASSVLRLQGELIDGWLGEGITDVWVALDACDAADLRLRRTGSRRNAAGNDAERDLIAVGRATLYWFVALGRSDLHTAANYLQTLARDFAVFRDPRLASERRPINLP
jgi:hypothetical protein